MYNNRRSQFAGVPVARQQIRTQSGTVANRSACRTLLGSSTDLPQSSANANSTTNRTPQSIKYRNSSDGVSAVFGSSGGTSLGSSLGRIRPRGSSSPAVTGRFDSHGSLGGSGTLSHSSSARQPSPTVNSLAYETKVFSSIGTTSNRPIQLSSGLGSLQGFRPTMEDNHFSIIHGTQVESQPISMFGILDGHCGRKVADLGCKLLPEAFFEHSQLGINNALALVESVVCTDRKIFQTMGKTDGGSTLITAAIHNRFLYVACVGDARAVLYESDSCRSVTTPMSEDHKPSDPKESIRIARCGGMVQFGRVCGCLAVSRALGDFEFKFTGNRFIPNKELMVSNVADIKQINITDSSRFLILACDGLWDVLTNEEATQFVVDYLKRCPVPKNSNTPAAASTIHDGGIPSASAELHRHLEQCAIKLADHSIERGSMDNVSVMIIAFHIDLLSDMAGRHDTEGLGNSSSQQSLLNSRPSSGSNGVQMGRGGGVPSRNNSNYGGGLTPSSRGYGRKW